MKTRKQRFLPAFIVIIVMFLLIAAYVVGSYAMVRPSNGRICDGVYVDQVDVSGMTREEAQMALNSQVEKLSSRSLEVDVNGQVVTTTLAELGYTCDVGDAIDQAMEVGREGNVVSNYASIRQLSQEHKEFALPVLSACRQP